MKDVFHRLVSAYKTAFANAKLDEDAKQPSMMNMEAMTFNYMKEQFLTHETKASTLEKLLSKHIYPYNPLDNVNYITTPKEVTPFFEFLKKKLDTVPNVTDDEKKALAEAQTVLTKEYQEGEKPVLLTPACYEQLATFFKKLPQSILFGMVDVIRCIVASPNMYYLTTQNCMNLFCLLIHVFSYIDQTCH